ncbi:hypothetical protein SAMN04488128_103205 [Chitinophaga eiseniae]|uniref:Uncharacterized protein n=1 Tax=Chitinophaga eiseniae TaxID=634771 RepID=A0A1T4SPC0_9BACT|nr:hypothetical protein [Chitinophaga eiseniae]SKA30023.1 hypothetical protein SAMN04488128_103205 [Chitinophaga eiseniae]
MTLLQIRQLLVNAADQMYLAHQFQEAAFSAHENDFESFEDYAKHLDYNVFMCEQSKAAADKLMEQANAANLALTAKKLAA